MIPRRQRKNGRLKARRVLEVRCGELLGDAEIGANQHSEGSLASEGCPLARMDRLRFRQLAASKARVVELLGEGTPGQHTDPSLASEGSPLGGTTRRRRGRADRARTQRFARVRSVGGNYSARAVRRKASDPTYRKRAISPRWARMIGSGSGSSRRIALTSSSEARTCARRCERAAGCRRRRRCDSPPVMGLPRRRPIRACAALSGPRVRQQGRTGSGWRWSRPPKRALNQPRWAGYGEGVGTRRDRLRIHPRRSQGPASAK